MAETAFGLVFDALVAIKKHRDEIEEAKGYAQDILNAVSIIERIVTTQHEKVTVTLHTGNSSQQSDVDPDPDLIKILTNLLESLNETKSLLEELLMKRHTKDAVLWYLMDLFRKRNFTRRFVRCTKTLHDRAAILALYKSGSNEKAVTHLQEEVALLQEELRRLRESLLEEHEREVANAPVAVQAYNDKKVATFVKRMARSYTEEGTEAALESAEISTQIEQMTTRLTTSTLQNFKNKELKVSLSLDSSNAAMQIGKPGMSAFVFEAQLNGHRVALKCLKKGADRDAFRDEERILARSKHENIVQMFGYSNVIVQNEPYPCLVLERCDTSLHEFMYNTSSPRELKSSERYAVLRGILRALEYLNESNIVHRDLKPLNVLLSYNFGRVKLCDFGDAVELDFLDHYSVTERAFGQTFAYASPEALRPNAIREGLLTTKADVYSFAVLCWEIVTCSPPYLGMNHEEIKEDILQGNRLHLVDLKLRQSEWLIALLHACWQEDPARRPSASDALDTIEKCYAPERVLKRRSTRILRNMLSDFVQGSSSSVLDKKDTLLGKIDKLRDFDDDEDPAALKLMRKVSKELGRVDVSMETGQMKRDRKRVLKNSPVAVFADFIRDSESSFSPRFKLLVFRTVGFLCRASKAFTEAIVDKSDVLFVLKDNARRAQLLDSIEYSTSYLFCFTQIAHYLPTSAVLSRAIHRDLIRTLVLSHVVTVAELNRNEDEALWCYHVLVTISRSSQESRIDVITVAADAVDKTCAMLVLETIQEFMNEPKVCCNALSFLLAFTESVDMQNKSMPIKDVSAFGKGLKSLAKQYKSDRRPAARDVMGLISRVVEAVNKRRRSRRMSIRRFDELTARIESEKLRDRVLASKDEEELMLHSLRGNISTGDVLLLAELIPLSSWERFNVPGKVIGDKGAAALGEKLAEEPYVEDARVRPTMTLSRALCVPAVPSNETLVVFSVGNNRIGDPGATGIAQGLSANRSLTELYLGGNLVGTAGANALADALKGNTTLTMLNMIENVIRDDGAKALGDALKVNKTLRWISLWKNHIGDDGAKALAEGINANRNLEVLVLTYNEIGNKGAAAFAVRAGLKTNTVLKAIHLQFNDVTEKAGLKIHEIDTRLKFGY